MGQGRHSHDEQFILPTQTRFLWLESMIILRSTTYKVTTMGFDTTMHHPTIP